MWIAILILGVIWGGLLIPVFQERRAWILCAHGGSGLFFTSLVLSLGIHQTGRIADIMWLKITGFGLLVPAVFLIAAAMVSIPIESLSETGILAVVRHPMYLGTVMASLALILIFQSILSLCLSIPAVLLLITASKLEDAYNLERFGDGYREYIKNVPGWNVFKGLK